MSEEAVQEAPARVVLVREAEAEAGSSPAGARPVEAGPAEDSRGAEAQPRGAGEAGAKAPIVRLKSAVPRMQPEQDRLE